MKLPSFKMSLPKIGFLSRFGKKKADEGGDGEGLDEDGFDDEPLDKAGDKAEEEDKGAPAGDGLDDELEDEDEEGTAEEGKGFTKKRLILVAAIAIPIVLVLVGGGVWFVLSSDESEEMMAKDKSQSKSMGMVPRNKKKPLIAPQPGPEGVPRVVALLPPRGGAGGLTPEGQPSAETEGGDTEGPSDEVPGQGVIIPAATAASFAAIVNLPADVPLVPAPAAGLFEEGSNGMLPRVGTDGRMPWKVYAKPHKGASDIPSIAVIVRDLGLSRAVTNAVIRKLPAAITLAFNPYAEDISDWVRLARERGHETLISLPMEPREFPIFDPGPYALRTLATPADNIRLLEYVLGRTVGYVGVLSRMGSKFSQNQEQLEPILSVLKARGLMFVDGSHTTGSKASTIAARLSLPRAVSDVVLDRALSKALIEAALSDAEGLARKRVVAIVTVDPTPVAIEAIQEWAATLEGKNLVLAPVSALVNKQISQ